MGDGHHIYGLEVFQEGNPLRVITKVDMPVYSHNRIL